MVDKKAGRVVVIPHPLQGHVHPLMHISKHLAKQGIRITMINTDFIHNKLVQAMGDNMHQILGPNIQLTSLPDGFPLHENRDGFRKLFVDLPINLKPQFEKLLANMNADEDGISCAIVDISMAWVLEIAEELGIRGSIYTPFTAAHSVINFSINELIENGVIDPEGVPLKEKVELKSLVGCPPLYTRDFPWRCVPWKNAQKMMFDNLVRIQRGCHYAKFCILVVPHVLEPQVVSLNPKLLTLGPLISTEAGQLWKEDASCLDWLDRQSPGSVVYMAFGSTGDQTQQQFEELAMGMEMTRRPFLWVVRAGTEKQFPKEFKGERGKIVSWVPQQKVLKHPAVGIFLSHCGWNSVIEGVTSGVPFLCMPCVGDHHLNKHYLAEIWRVGVGFDKDHDGLVTRWEINRKVDQLMGDEAIKATSRAFSEEIGKCWEVPHGRSVQNFDRLVRWIEQEEEEEEAVVV